MTEVSDNILLDRLKSGDVKALGLLYERYKSVLHNYFLRATQDYDVSNDLLIETFERVYKYKKSFQSGRVVKSWLYRIASNVMKDHFKKTKQIQDFGNRRKFNVETEVPENDITSDIKYRHQQMYTALERLNPLERNLIQMYYLLEMSYEDMAKSEGITVNNARIKVCRALKKLKELLKDSEL